MNLLDSIQRGPEPKPPRLLIYGTEGVGKSSTAAQAPRPIFIQTEDGLDEIDCDRFPLATSLDQVFEALSQLRSQSHDYETVAIDSLDWLERLIFDRLCAEHGAGSIDQVAGGYGKGYTLALSLWRELIAELSALRNQRGMAILLIAHSKVERFEDPESSPYDRYSPRLHKHAAALVCEWCDAVVFATQKMRTQSEEAGFNRKRTTAQPIGAGGGERVMRCVGRPSCVAKNRYGIADELPLSWSALMSAISSHQQGVNAHG